jgi:hypothetical protein
MSLENFTRPGPIDGYNAARRLKTAVRRAADAAIEKGRSRGEEWPKGWRPGEPFESHETILERVKFANSQSITMEFLRRARGDAEYLAAQRLVRQTISGLIPAMGGDRLIFPKGWKDHAKRDMPPRLKRFLEWLLRRPLVVETEVYEVTRFVGGLPEMKDDRLVFLDVFRRRDED